MREELGVLSRMNRVASWCVASLTDALYRYSQVLLYAFLGVARGVVECGLLDRRPRYSQIHIELGIDGNSVPFVR